MIPRLLYEFNLPPEGIVEFKWKASAKTNRVQIKRLLVQPALLTYPVGCTRTQVMELLSKDSLYLYLRELQQKPVNNPFSPIYRMRQHQIVLEQSERVLSIESQLISQGVRILVPLSRTLDSYRVQRFAYEYLIQFLYIEAEELLRPFVESCAEQVGVSFNKMKITAPSLKWGSCSSEGTLIFSVFAMLLPNELLRYLVFHELAHITHMNHGTPFWELLSKYLGEDAQLYEKKLQNFNAVLPSIPELF